MLKLFGQTVKNVDAGARDNQPQQARAKQSFAPEPDDLPFQYK